MRLLYSLAHRLGKSLLLAVGSVATVFTFASGVLFLRGNSTFRPWGIVGFAVVFVSALLYGLLLKYADEKEGEFDYFDDRNLYYPSRQDISDEEAVEIHRKLKREKRASFDEWTRSVEGVDEERLQDVHDYVFKVAKYLWHIQQNWAEANGRYFQGKKTMPEPPDYRFNAEVSLPQELTDQVDGWREIGYIDDVSPAQLECHTYRSSEGDGYIFKARVKVNGTTWILNMDYGPLDRFGSQNLRWQPENSPPSI